MRVKKSASFKNETTGDPGIHLQVARQQLAKAEKLRTQKSFDKAETICTELLRKYPDYFGALHTLGLIYADKGNQQRAVNSLVQAAIRNPRSWATHTALAGCYLSLGSTEMAADALSKANEIRSNDPNVLLTLGHVYLRDRKYQQAFETFQKAFEVAPDLQEAAIGIATSGLELGEYKIVAEVLGPLMEVSPISLQALHIYSHLPNQCRGQDILKLFDRLVDEKSETYRTRLAFVRAEAQSSNGLHEEAWDTLVEANNLQIASFAGPEAERELRSHRQRVEWLRENPNVGTKCEHKTDATFTSLFILGPSRSGKTVVETLLGAHSRVCRGYENPSLRDAITQTYMDAGLPSWASLQYLPSNLRNEARNHYDRINSMIPVNFNVVTNTSPGHIWDSFQINEVIPNSKFIFIERDFYDLALRIYMRQYRVGHYYSYNLTYIKKFIETYREIMSLFNKRIPEQTLVLKYSDVVESPADTFKKIVQFCDLDMEDVVLPSIGDDRNCSDPYRHRMDVMLAAKQV